MNKELHSASQMGLYCLPMTHIFDARLIWVKYRKYICLIVSYDFSEVRGSFTKLPD